SVLLAALVTELLVLFLFWGMEVPYLWLNMVGALAVPILSLIWEFWALQVSSRTSSITQFIQK
ncbi:MAG: hypothetical protein ACKOKH_01200, partial [Bacteroidota bacterium]